MSTETLRALDPRRALAGARTRVLLAFVVLLALSTLVSTLALRQILLARAGERVEEALIQEVGEFREQGERSGADVRALFDAFLARNVPAEGEVFFTFLDGRPYRSTEGAPSERLLARVSQLGRITGTERGEVATTGGDVRYLAVPVSIDGRRRGVFVVAIDLGQERREVTEAVRVAAGVALAVLLLASALAWVIAGRVLAPLRTLSEHRPGDHGDRPHPSHRGRGPRRDRRPRPDVQRHARPARGRLRHARRRSSATPATSCARRSRSSAGTSSSSATTPRSAGRPSRSSPTSSTGWRASSRTCSLLARAERPRLPAPGAVDLDVLTDEVFAKAPALADRDWKPRARGAGRLTADRQRLTQARRPARPQRRPAHRPGGPIALGSALTHGEARLWVARHRPRHRARRPRADLRPLRPRRRRPPALRRRRARPGHRARHRGGARRPRRARLPRKAPDRRSR